MLRHLARKARKSGTGTVINSIKLRIDKLHVWYHIKHVIWSNTMYRNSTVKCTEFVPSKIMNLSSHRMYTPYTESVMYRKRPNLHYTGRSKGIRVTSPAVRACRLVIHDTAEGWRGGRRETLTLYQHPHDTKTVQYCVLATSNRWCHAPSTRRQWWRQSQLSISKLTRLSAQIGVVCMFSLDGLCHPLRISCVLKRPAQHTLVTTAHMAQKTLVLFSAITKKPWFSVLVTITAQRTTAACRLYTITLIDNQMIEHILWTRECCRHLVVQPLFCSCFSFNSYNTTHCNNVSHSNGNQTIHLQTNSQSVKLHTKQFTN